MSTSNNGWAGFGIGVMSVIVLGVAGCKKSEDARPEVKTTMPQVEVKRDNAGTPVVAQPVSRSNGLRLLPFREAVLLEPPTEEELIPPDRTCTGKSTGKIFEAIANDLWDKVAFSDEAGRPLRYQAVMATDLGSIHIELFGASAPNHVRNFICLARSGYFDGMKFYYSLNAKVEDDVAAYIETGCPRGTGASGSGSIGYWLKPEINPKLTHDEGVLGACLNGEADTAASRFYITAAKMPQMDGLFTIFGKVTQGLDIVRTINTRAVDEDGHLKEPVLIRSVTVSSALK